MSTYMPDLSAAACATPRGRLIFDDITPTTIPQARKICADCPVARQCLAWAVQHECSGMWGGRTKEQLDGIRRQQHIRLVPLNTGQFVGAQHTKRPAR